MTLPESIIRVKREYNRQHKPDGFLNEIIPLKYSRLLPIDNSILDGLNNFALNNSIYSEHKDTQLFDIPCRVYSGDINSYWLSSKKYDTNYQPFYPTWILSAFVLSDMARKRGFRELVDIGSGDGRIAFCAALAGLNAVGIEIDSDLVTLQKEICRKTNIHYTTINIDATTMNYENLKLERPIFFISGLPECGEMLAKDVLSKTRANPHLRRYSGFNFMGSQIMRRYSNDHTQWGWGKIIEEFDLKILDVLSLPTFWKSDQLTDTKYLYASFK